MYGVCHSDHVSSYCADFYAQIGRRPFEAAHTAASLAHAAGMEATQDLRRITFKETTGNLKVSESGMPK